MKTPQELKEWRAKQPPKLPPHTPEQLAAVKELWERHYSRLWFLTSQKADPVFEKLEREWGLKR